ncbi:unnamed protein product [Camellia sinensis]
MEIFSLIQLSNANRLSCHDEEHDDPHVTEAKQMSHAIQKKHFTFDTYWEILRQSCKWDKFRSKRSMQPIDPCSHSPTECEASQSNQNNAVHEQPSNTSTRPIGTKAAK